MPKIHHPPQCIARSGNSLHPTPAIPLVRPVHPHFQTAPSESALTTLYPAESRQSVSCSAPLEKFREQLHSPKSRLRPTRRPDSASTTIHPFSPHSKRPPDETPHKNQAKRY